MPTQFHSLLALSFISISCANSTGPFESSADGKITENFPDEIWGISLPPGFSYVYGGDSAYAKWLLSLKLKKSKSVYYMTEV